MKNKQMSNETNCPEQSEEQIAAKAETAVNSYESAEIAAILNKTETEFREWLTEFARYMASQNPEQPLPPRP